MKTTIKISFSPTEHEEFSVEGLDLNGIYDKLELYCIYRALALCKGNQKKMGEMLKLPARSSLQSKLEKLDLLGGDISRKKRKRVKSVQLSFLDKM